MKRKDAQIHGTGCFLNVSSVTAVASYYAAQPVETVPLIPEARAMLPTRVGAETMTATPNTSGVYYEASFFFNWVGQGMHSTEGPSSSNLPLILSCLASQWVTCPVLPNHRIWHSPVVCFFIDFLWWIWCISQLSRGNTCTDSLLSTLRLRSSTRQTHSAADTSAAHLILTLSALVCFLRTFLIKWSNTGRINIMCCRLKLECVCGAGLGLR